MRIDQVNAVALTIPTEEPESDGTLEWDTTTMVLAEVRAGGITGIGYSYTHDAAARLIDTSLAGVIVGREIMDVTGAWAAMRRSLRNAGQSGLVASAIAAVDTALWDLKARVLNLPLVSLFGAVRGRVPVYGSGGFTGYPVGRLQEQLAAWVEQGIREVKMKVGTHPEEDLDRVKAACDAVGPATLFVDANGAYERKQALWFAEAFGDLGVTWFEEPVSSDDMSGLRLLRDRAPAGMDIAAGEYGYDLFYFRRMLEVGAVDVLQADATRCAGFTGFLRAAVLCEAHAVQLSAHTAPSLHAHIGCAVLPLRHVEYFHDHVRLEHMVFDGALGADGGYLEPDPSQPGMGLALKRADVMPFLVYGAL